MTRPQEASPSQISQDSVELTIQSDLVETPEERKELTAKFSRMIVSGILWAVGGSIATFISMESASNGGTYFVFWGAIVFGIIDVIRGLVGWLEYSTTAMTNEG